MNMKMEKQYYKDALAPLPSGVLDGLRRMVEFIDKALAQEHHRDIHFKADGFWDESGFFGSIFGELTASHSYDGAAAVEAFLQNEWQVLTNTDKGALQLQYDNYINFKTALKDILKQQPFGYVRALEQPTSKPQVSVVSKDAVVYFQFNDERPLRIARVEDKQGKLLLFLGNPIGVSRTIQSVSEELDGDITTIQNAMKEIQSKLTAKQKPRSVRLGFSETMVWIEAV